MKFLIILICTLAIGIGVVAYTNGSKAAPIESASSNSKLSPRPVGSPSEIHLGTVAPNSVVEHDLTVNNSSDQTWLINSVKTSCGCTTAKLPQRKIPPDSSIRIPLKFETGKESRLRTVGIIVSFTEGPPAKKFTLRADVKAPLSLTPLNVRKKVAAGESISLSVLVENFSGKKWDTLQPMAGTRNNLSWVTATPGPLIEASRAVGRGALQRSAVSVVLSSENLTEGVHRGFIEFKGRGDDGFEVTCQQRVSLEVIPEVTLVPDVLLVRADSDQSCLKKFTLRLAHDLPTSAKVSLLSREAPASDISIVEQSIIGAQTVVVALKFGGLTSSHREVLKFRIEGHDKSVELPITIVCD